VSIDIDPVFGRTDAPITFVAHGPALLPVYDVTCIVCAGTVDVDDRDAVVGRINGDSRYGYEASHGTCLNNEWEASECNNTP
jgi:hypothetical protein